MADKTEKAIRRILKCLRLSSDPAAAQGEAEAAMRQAQKLMQEYRVSENQIKAAEATEYKAKAGAINTPTSWETFLAVKCGKAFGCECLFVTKVKITEDLNIVRSGFWHFIGVGSYPISAAYSFEVLFRQAKNARAVFIREKLKRYKPKNRTKNADMFCEGWVQVAIGKLSNLTLSKDEQAAVDASMENKKTQSLKTMDRNKGKIGNAQADAYYAGRQGGKEAQLNNAVGAGETPRQLGCG